MKTRTQNQPGTGGASSSSNAFKWLISLWPIVSVAHRNAHYAEQVKGCGMGGKHTLTNEIAGNAQNANEMCNHPGMQHNAKCVNILPQPNPPSLPHSLSPPPLCVTWVKCPAGRVRVRVRFAPVSAMWHVRLLYKFRIYCQWQNMIRKLILLIK